MSNDQPPPAFHEQVRGAWRVLSITVAGDDTPREDEAVDSSHFLWFKDDVIVTGDQWAAWDMPYEIQDDCTPVAIDIIRNDRWDPWIQKGIIEVAGEILRICGAESSSGPRPSGFTSTAIDRQVLHIAERCNELLPE